MLKTNTKKARENVRAYIMNIYDASGYELPEATTFEEVAANIYNTFKAEKYYSDNYMMRHRIPEAASFADWCAGLPSIIDTCYYYNRSAVDDLAGILEETDAEKAKFSEEAAEERLTALIWREIEKAVKGY